MSASVFEVFSVGIGPSSSHTVGPMRAAQLLLTELSERGVFEHVAGLHIEFFGALAATGPGHGSDKALIAGLTGALPETACPDDIATGFAQAIAAHRITLRHGDHEVQIPFNLAQDLELHCGKRLPYHPNALRFRVRINEPSDGAGVPAGTGHSDGNIPPTRRQSETDAAATSSLEFTYYSVGGGFIVSQDQLDHPVQSPETALPYPFRSGTELIAQCVGAHKSIPQVMEANEIARGRSRNEVRRGILHLWEVMCDCIERGCRTEGVLPGGLGVRRRAPHMLQQLMDADQGHDPLIGLDWVSLWALATNEENAAGGRIVTAPTNGAAGIVPAVLRHAMAHPAATEDTVIDFLLTAGAIGAIYQASASISGAEVGCQGEIGVACSMAAAGLCQVRGGSAQQVTNAAEIGLEHHLGLTCDPVGGLVQVPCIERNAVGASTAITAARLALAGDGRQMVSLDQVIETMMATGADMSTKYKETSQGGLALSITAC